MRKLFSIIVLLWMAASLCLPLAFAAPIESTSAIPEPPLLRLQVPLGDVTGFSKEVGGENITAYLAIVYQWLIRAVIVLSVLMFTIAGFVWITAGGESGQVKKAHEIIKSTLIGLALALGSYAILYNTNPNLVKPLNLHLGNINEQNIEIEAYIPPSASSTPITPAATPSVTVPTAAGTYATKAEADTKCPLTCTAPPKTEGKVSPHVGGTGFDCECVTPAAPPTPAGAVCDAGQLPLYPTGTDTPRDQCVSKCNTANPFSPIGLNGAPIQKTDTASITYYCCPCP